jgi:hypothetical protein
LFASGNTSLIIGLITNYLIQLFHDKIWLPHCNKLIDKERSLGISSRLKKLKKRKKKKSVSAVLATHTKVTIFPSQKREDKSTTWKSWLTLALKFGNSWLDFVNRY